LEDIAMQLRAHARRGRPAWCIFDNTAHSHAIEDALRLQALVIPAKAGIQIEATS
jgi:uncharacterized protein YecE (DUF72 family)